MSLNTNNYPRNDYKPDEKMLLYQNSIFDLLTKTVSGYQIILFDNFIYIFLKSQEIEGEAGGLCLQNEREDGLVRWLSM